MSRKDIVFLVKETINAWRADDASRLAAALSYYTIFSLTPLLVIAIAVTGQIYGEGARGRVSAQASRYLGRQVADALGVIIENASEPATGLVAGGIAVATLLFGATRVFAQLMNALDEIWHVRPAAGYGVVGTIKDRFLAFGMLLVIGVLFLLTLIVSTAITRAGELTSQFAASSFNFAPIVNIFLSLILSTILFAAIFKVLPRVNLQWRDVGVGAVATAILFVIGKELIGLYLGRVDPSSGFGAAGSLIVLLIFVYFSFQIFLLGAEFTKIYSRNYGSRGTVEAGAVRFQIVTGEELPVEAVAETMPEEEVQLIPQPVEAEGLSTTGQPEREERHPARVGSDVHRWLVITVAAFVVGLLIGDRRQE